MRLLAIVVAASVLATGCATNSYRIPRSDLARLANTPPAERGHQVRVIQDLSNNGAPPAQRVDSGTEIIFVPNITVSSDHRRGYGGGYGGGGGGSSGGGVKGSGGKLGGAGNDAKGAAVVFLVAAAVALVAIAGVEGSRYDGWARLHPMHPVHLFGKDGGYTVVPLAWIDREAVAWADKAMVRDTEGPWLQLGRAPLDRAGPTYGMFAGAGSMRSAFGDLALGPAFTVQAGFFPTQHVGLLASVFLGWRDNRIGETMFDSRYMLELQAMPLALGKLHAGFYVGGGGAYRFEDGVDRGNSSSSALAGGGMLQLDVNTRIALTARFGVAKAHEERTRDILFGMAVY